MKISGVLFTTFAGLFLAGCAAEKVVSYDKPGSNAHGFRMDTIVCRMEPGYVKLPEAERRVSMDKCLRSFGWIPQP